MILIIISCAAPEQKVKPPNWIYHPYEKYNQDYYLTALGTGDTRSAAEKDAFANISKIFKTDISARETVQQKFIEKTGENLSSEEKMNKITNIKTEQSLKNIKTAESFFDKKEGIYYVLVYLDRMETSSIYEDEIRLNNQKIYTLYRDYHKAINKIEKLKYLQRAINMAEENERLNSQLRVISTVAQEVDLKIDTDDLISEKARFAKTIKVSIVSTGKYSRYISDYLCAVFAKIGFTVFPAPKATSDYYITSTLKIKKINLKRENIEFVRWNLAITITDQEYGGKEATYTRSGRVGHVNIQEAASRAIRDAKKVIMNDFYNFFMSEF